MAAQFCTPTIPSYSLPHFLDYSSTCTVMILGLSPLDKFCADKYNGGVELAGINPKRAGRRVPSEAGGSTLTPSRPRNGPLRGALERNESGHLLPSLNVTVSETHEVLQILTFHRTLLFY